MELKFKESKKNYYILTILGSIRTGKYSQKYETIVSQCSDKNWSDIDALFFSYIAKKNSGIITIIMPIAAKVEFPIFFNRKKVGTPIAAAIQKQMS